MSAQELITDHLDLWTGVVTHKSGSGHSASGKNGKIELTGIKKLRELILELAVRGKLVPQSPEDTSFSELLLRLRKNHTPPKTRGRQTVSGEVALDEQPFNIPRGWAWTRIGETAEILDSQRKPITKSARKDGPYPYYGASGIVDYVNDYLFDEPLVLVGEDGAKWDKGEGTAFPISGKTWVNNHAHVLRPRREAITDEYLVYFLTAADLNQYITGMTVPKLNQARLSSIPVATPCLEEQHRIVEKVDELMALCDRLEQQVGDQMKAHEVLVDTLLDALTRSADAAEVAESWAHVAEHFDTLFTTEASIDKLKLVVLDLAASGKLIDFHVEKRPLKNILSFGPRNGLSPKESSFHTGIKVLKLGATTKGTLKLSESKDIDIDEPESSHLWLKKGDILIQRGNAARHVGCNIMIESNQPGFIYPDLMMKIRTKKEANPKFISYCLSSPQSRIFMWDRMTGTSGTMPKISKKTVESIPVPLPDIKTQTATVEKVDELMALCDRLKVRLGETAETRAQLAEAVVNQTVS
ncbi:restriction endonuclease subunit S [Chromohalobacter israelensis]|uniref:restriction endonuclease subunit S n=1 Tax=Chromohalobacter israelensis TaxID=141390 RepID=UPI000FFF686E|nr:restriction endonuclease subunit S [Chromohalobacter salexigens]RXE47626.1 hypothetical protein B4O83_06350 [Chromohalobacter salexigens]